MPSASIHAYTCDETEYKILLSNIRTSELDELNEFINAIPPHPNVLSPSSFEFTTYRRQIWVSYKVSKNGMTLRNWISALHSNTTRTSFMNIHIRSKKKHAPVDIILQLIDAYNFMLTNNILLTQTSINPDCIWVEYDSYGKLSVRAINTLETLASDYCGTVDVNKRYWSAELIRKFDQVTYYNNNEGFDDESPPNNIKLILHSTNQLTRYNTRPSTLSTVYSLGLVLYFIATNEDLFHEQTVHAFDHIFIKNTVNPWLVRHIRTAIESDISKRPTMNEWKESFSDKNGGCTVA